MAESVKWHEKLRVYIFAILFGALINAFYDVFLKDFFYSVGNGFVRVVTYVYSGYTDRLYANVGVQMDSLAHFPGVLLLLFLIMSPIFFNLFLKKKLRYIQPRHLRKEETNTKFENYLFKEAENNPDRFRKWVLGPLVICSFLYIDIAICSISNNMAVKNIQMRLEIIRPYITEDSSNKLISEFRLVDNKEKLQKLVNKIDSIAKANSVKLPKLQLYGIK